MTNYLLEKSRVTGQAEGERCFHVMHYLLEGANELEREEFQLLPQRWVGGWVGLCLLVATGAGGVQGEYGAIPLRCLVQTPLTCTMDYPPSVPVPFRSQETRLVRSYGDVGLPLCEAVPRVYMGWLLSRAGWRIRSLSIPLCLALIFYSFRADCKYNTSTRRSL